MTAMVDVAFLLLTFFILTTTKFREDNSVEIDTPSSVSVLKPPETGLMTVDVDRDGRVFVGFSDIDLRTEALKMASTPDERDLAITEEGLGYFSSLQNFGVPFGGLPQWLDLEPAERKEFEQPGISAVVTDSTTMTGNELKAWVRYARLGNARLNAERPVTEKRRLRFAIHADSESPYGVISDVISTLQEWDINMFSLITTLEDLPEGYNKADAH